MEQHQVKHIRQTADGYEIDGKYACQYLVGAGGTYCPVYRTLFRETVPRPKENMIVAFEEEFEYGYTDPRCHLWFMENGLPGYAWYVPKANGFLNVGIGAKAEKLKKTGDTIQTRWDALTTKLDDLGLVRGHTWSPVSHTYYLRPQPLSATRIDNAFLVGDAACLSTRDMGEGIGPALLSGQRAAQAIITGGEYVLDDIPLIRCRRSSSAGLEITLYNLVRKQGIDYFADTCSISLAFRLLTISTTQAANNPNGTRANSGKSTSAALNGTAPLRCFLPAGIQLRQALYESRTISLP